MGKLFPSRETPTEREPGMTLLWIALGAGVVVALLAFVLAVGFASGVFAHSAVVEAFFTKKDDEAKRRAVLAVAEWRRKDAEHRVTIERVRAMYGQDLSERHQPEVSEDIERALGLGPNGGKVVPQ
mgnify:CR=1 FL=1